VLLLLLAPPAAAVGTADIDAARKLLSTSKCGSDAALPCITSPIGLFACGRQLIALLYPLTSAAALDPAAAAPNIGLALLLLLALNNIGLDLPCATGLDPALAN
jgi:hypothetical protein